MGDLVLSPALLELKIDRWFLKVFGVPIPPDAKVELDVDESVTVMLHCWALALAVLTIRGVLYLFGGGHSEFDEKMLLLLMCRGSFM